MTAAIYFHPEAYTATGPKLMGRNAAGESFLRGFLQHSRAERFAIQVMERAHAQSFVDVARSLDRKEPVAVVTKSNLGSHRTHGVVYHPGPGIADHARQRSFWGHEAWSLCGITHTTSSARAMDSVAQLIECGWHGNESIQRAFDQGAAKLCPSVNTVTLDGRKAEERGKAWAAADVFCSLSDNIQETFGISPIEAMAAGLPVVVSDWDGYKDTVRHGIDGFRVPTIMPRAGLGGDLALRHALEVDTYDMYIGHACSLTAVDVEATTAAFTALFESEDLRRRMGAAGQAHAREVYDWARIIPQYEDLWAELNEERRRAAAGAKTKANWPARPDPFAAFEAYPTHILTEATELEATVTDAEALCEQVEEMRALAMVNFAKLVLPTPDEVRLVLTSAVKGPTRAVDLVRDIATERRAQVFRGLGWLLKLGVLKLTDTAVVNPVQPAKLDEAKLA